MGVRLGVSITGGSPKVAVGVCVSVGVGGVVVVVVYSGGGSCVGILYSIEVPLSCWLSIRVLAGPQ